MVIDSGNSLLSSSGNTKNRIEGSHNATAKSRPADTPTPASDKPEVTLSAQAQQMNQLESRIQAAPDMDSQRVADIKKAIADGTFDINPESIAERMLEQDSLFR